MQKLKQKTSNLEAKLKISYQHLGWFCLWFVFVIACISLRPIFPLDETRYISVAWEMWLNKNFLVPHLNGIPYHHKPPLLFWIINFIWSFTEVNSLTARIVSPLFGLGTIVLTLFASKILWPNSEKIRTMVPWVMLGSVLFTVTCTLSMFDTLISFFTVFAIIGVILVYRSIFTNYNLRVYIYGLIVCSLSIGFGVLSKGPVIFVFILPTILFGPMFFNKVIKNFLLKLLFWYFGFIISIFVGSIIFLSWAIPASKLGGEIYANALLWGQSVNRITDGISHARPWWFYGALLPLLFFPWILYPRFLINIIKLDWKNNVELKLCCFIFSSSLIILTFFAEKQPHYILPIIPIFSLIFSKVVSELPNNKINKYIYLPNIFILLITLALIFIIININAYIPIYLTINKFDILNSLLILVPFFILCIYFLLYKNIGKNIIYLTSSQVLVLVLLIHLSFMPMVSSIYDLKPISKKISETLLSNIPIAHVGKYHGQYHFLGRLNSNIEVIEASEIAIWFKKNPNGKIIYNHRKLSDVLDANPEFFQPFRNRLVAIWGKKEAEKDLKRFLR